MRWSVLVLFGFLAALGGAPRAQAVDLALVLLNDVSKSMETRDYQLVKAGYRAAFADPDVIAALIGSGGGVAVTYLEFSGPGEVAVVKDWQILSDAASAQAFGEEIAAAPRSSAGNTSLSSGLRSAAQLLMDSDFGAARKVIDIASDHPSDGGRAAGVRDTAVAAGITINALPIIDKRPIGTYDGQLSYSTVEWGAGGILAFYQRDIIGGPGSFVVEAASYTAFGEALKRKLLLELIAAPEARTQAAALTPEK